MKGTLFSTDFIEDSTGNLKLLEVNTDTAIVDNALDKINLGGFIELLSGSNITEVYTITKEFHRNFVSLLSQSLYESASFITTFSNTEESWDSIYPTSIEDGDNKFILRMAYDESAIFDSTYAKNKLEPLKLFYDNSDTGSIASFYISSSNDGVYNTLPLEFNSTVVPDVVVKDIDMVNEPLSFYKIGNSSDDSQTRYDSFLDEIGRDKLTLKFYENSSNSHCESIRSVNILYGPDLDLLHLGTYTNLSLFEKPASITCVPEFNDSNASNKISTKHYYEFTTNTPRLTTSISYGGLFEEEEVIKADGTPILISSASEGTELKSYFINGAPDTDIVSEFMSWTSPGSTIPSGSYATSSVVINSIEQDLSFNIVQRIQLEDGNDFRASGGSHLLIYDSVDDVLRYESVADLDVNNHRILNLEGGTVAISQSYSEILNDKPNGSYKNYIIDMEETDTYFLYNGQASVKIVTHNCFPAGTKITLSDGTQKNVEDLTLQDKLLTWNEKTGELVEGVIGDIVKKKKNSLVELTTEDGTSIKSTPLHKFYSKERGWVSAKDLELGEILVKKANVESKLVGKEVIDGEVEVYHILNVKDTHTYFAEDLLVHNLKYVTCFTGDTNILLDTKEIKPISEIVAGDSILTYNETTGEHEVGVVGENESSSVDSVIRIQLEDDSLIDVTEEHPFYIKDKGLVKVKDIQIGDICIGVDGESIKVTSIETMDKIHTVYNLKNVTPNHNYYACGVLVHNK